MFKIIIKILIVFVIFFHYISTQTIKEVDYYVNLIQDSNAEAEKYEFPTDANEYAPESDTLTCFGSFDFIIIGGGTTGSVIARRLSDNSDVSVLVLETGDFGDNLTAVPSLSFNQMLSKKWNWGYKSIPQTTCCLGTKNNQCMYPRSKGVGGTSLMNGLISARGGYTDFNNWSKMTDAIWSYENVLPLFKKSETFDKNDPEAPVEPKYHGKTGPINVDYSRPSQPKVDVFLKAHQKLNYEILDYNGEFLVGTSPLQIATKHGRRVDLGTAYLKPVLDRKNLKIMTHSYVTKITFHKYSTTSASGVIFTHDRQLYSATAKKEVILSAGVIGSPQLLMLSGIGPKCHLQSHKIKLVKDLEVGSTFREHPMYYGLSIMTNLTDPTPSMKEQVEQFLQGKGPLTVPGNNFAASFLSPDGTRKKPGKIKTYADIELLLNIAPYKKSRSIVQKALGWTDKTYEAFWGRDFEDSKSMEIFVCLLHERSSGTLRLKSSDPYDYPLIDPNMLSDKNNRDLQVMYEAIQTVLDLLHTEPFKKIRAYLHAKPHPECEKYRTYSKTYWFCMLKQATQTVFHPVGTCPMGLDSKKGAVVDPWLKVHDVHNLRVADASIFPTTLSGHPYFPCVMIGELVSDLIKRDHNLD